MTVCPQTAYGRSADPMTGGLLCGGIAAAQVVMLIQVLFYMNEGLDGGLTSFPYWTLVCPGRHRQMLCHHLPFSSIAPVFAEICADLAKPPPTPMFTFSGVWRSAS